MYKGSVPDLETSTCLPCLLWSPFKMWNRRAGTSGNFSCMTFAINMFEETVANWFNQFKKWVPLGPTGAQRCPGIIDPQCDAVETCRAAGQELFCQELSIDRLLCLWSPESPESPDIKLMKYDEICNSQDFSRLPKTQETHAGGDSGRMPRFPGPSTCSASGRIFARGPPRSCAAQLGVEVSWHSQRLWWVNLCVYLWIKNEICIVRTIYIRNIYI